MSRLMVSIAALALAAGQASVAAATTKDSPVVIKASMPFCAVPGKTTKLTRAAPAVNRCDTDDDHHRRRIGVVPLVFGGAIIAGVVAIAVDSNNNNNGNGTSP